jgi:Xaa-Pro aminopeptidase
LFSYYIGTGHGVGAYLNVHEGPMGISWRPYPDDPGLQEGMVLSDEPGYYQDGDFGIRIENLVQVVKANTPHNFRDRGYLTFENLTLVPIQMKMIDPQLLNKDEINYINQYHEKCLDTVGPLLREMGHKEGLNWLVNESRPIG